MTLGLFVQYLIEPSTRFFFLAWVLVVVISIVLHELAHGWTAMRLGDPTPAQTGRLTGNPLVHMGPFSIAALLIAGIAWGSMPVDHSRLRGRYAESWVSLAGPAMNLLLAVVSLVGLGLLLRFDALPAAVWAENLDRFLRIAGMANLLLCLFNLLPVPPLDGSHVLANLHRGYANFISDPSKQGVFIFMFIGAFILAQVLLEPVIGVANWLLAVVAG